MEGKKLSRREVLKLGVAAVGGAALGTKVYLDHQQTFNKVASSVVQGRAGEDLQQIVDSQIAKKEQLELGGQVNYDSGWLDGFFDSEHFFSIEGKETNRVAFLEITNKGKVEITKDLGVDISTAFGDQAKSFMTLPYPQNDRNNKYAMYAIFNQNEVPVLASDVPKSEERGGLILQDGHMRVGYPGDFSLTDLVESYNSFDPSRPNSAQLEYFFVLDSQNKEQDLSTLENMRGPVGKNFRNAQEFSSAIVSYFDQNGSFRTFVISSFRDINKDGNQFEPRLIDDFTIPQLVSLAQDFGEKNMLNSNRFIVAFADPGPNQYLANSRVYGNQELINSNLSTFRARDIPEENYPNTLFHRVLGGNASASSVYRPVLANKPAYLVVGS